jgi:hypothetical protein
MPAAAGHLSGEAATSIQSANDREALLRLITSACGVARDHTACSHGMCTGCLTGWDRLVPHPCTHAEWARTVLDRYRVGVMSRSLMAASPTGCPGSR